jgi:1-acyl-sn-glycerol-3-phosphate acyltransferase
MSEPLRCVPRPATTLVRMLVGEVKVVGTLPEGPVLLCGNHVSYRDVFLFGMSVRRCGCSCIRSCSCFRS